MTKPRTASCLAGLIALLYSGIGLWRPSFWTDEAATLSAVRRSLPELVAMLGSIDAVHGLYYLFMFGWTRILGYSEFAVRLPSLVAIAFSAAIMVELGRKLSSVEFGIFAAAFLVVMPRTQYVATDARSYALTVLGAVTATYVLVSIRERPSTAKWVLYSAIGAVSVSLSFYVVFLFVAHAVTLLLDPILRKTWRGLTAASIGWFAPALLIAGTASQQQFQISWIRPVGPSFLFEFSVLQFFADGYFAKENQVAPVPTPGEDFSMIALACLLWSAAAVGLVMSKKHFVVLLAVPWLVVPATAVIGGSLLTGGNYYLPRYLSFELPALAILAAAPAIALNLPSACRITAVAVSVSAALVVAIPSYVGQRTQFGRDPQDDFRYIAESVENLSAPGDAFVISPAQGLASQAYPDSFQGLADPTRGISAAEWQRIFDQRLDVASSAVRVLQHPTVILVEKSNESVMAQELIKLGYAPGESLRGPATTVTRYSRN